MLLVYVFTWNSDPELGSTSIGRISIVTVALSVAPAASVTTKVKLSVPT